MISWNGCLAERPDEMLSSQKPTILVLWTKRSSLVGDTEEHSYEKVDEYSFLAAVQRSEEEEDWQ